MAKKYKKRYMVTFVYNSVWTRYLYVNKSISNLLGSIADDAAHHSLCDFNGSLHTYAGRVPGTFCTCINL